MSHDGFEYPPVPDSYSNVCSTSDPFDTYDGHYAPAFENQAETEPHSYPYYGLKATVPSTASPYETSSTNPAFGDSTYEQATSVPGPVFSLRPELPMYPTTTHRSPSFSDITHTEFAAHSVEIVSKKRPRGTTGNVVCDKCGGKFTVNSSLNRHNKICRGRKSSKKPSSTQRKSTLIKNEGLMSDYNTDFSRISHERPGHEIEIHPISTSSTVAVFLGSGNASAVSDFALPESFLERSGSV